MSARDDWRDFELRVRALLEQGTQGVGGPVRSRLTRARHAALGGVGAGREGLRVWPRLLAWLPVAAAAAAVLWLLGPYPSLRSPPAVAARVVTAQDVDLLTDRDGLALVEEGDGEFYEWAVAQAQSAPPSSAVQGGRGKNGG